MSPKYLRNERLRRHQEEFGQADPEICEAIQKHEEQAKEDEQQMEERQKQELDHFRAWKTISKQDNLSQSSEVQQSYMSQGAETLIL